MPPTGQSKQRKDPDFQPANSAGYRFANTLHSPMQVRAPAGGAPQPGSSSSARIASAPRSTRSAASAVRSTRPACRSTEHEIMGDWQPRRRRPRAGEGPGLCPIRTSPYQHAAVSPVLPGFVQAAITFKQYCTSQLRTERVFRPRPRKRRRVLRTAKPAQQNAPVRCAGGFAYNIAAKAVLK